jgi:predicted neutral ceramidase superfamily lipid hydrolase
MSKRLRLYFTTVFAIVLSMLLTWSLPASLSAYILLDYLVVYSVLMGLFLIASYIISDDNLGIKLLLSLVVLISIFAFGALLFEYLNQKSSIMSMGSKNFVFWSFYELSLMAFLFLTLRASYRLFKNFKK